MIDNYQQPLSILSITKTITRLNNYVPLNNQHTARLVETVKLRRSHQSILRFILLRRPRYVERDGQCFTKLAKLR